MSERYLPPMSRKVTEGVLVAEMLGWQLHHDTGLKTGGFRFKAIDVRDQRARLKDPLAPARRVWTLLYNTRMKTVSKDGVMLNEFYPAVFVWAKEEMEAYCLKNGMENQPFGGFRNKAAVREAV